jgi:hypothetical protein
MTEADKRRQALDAALEGIRRGWFELESTTLTPDERKVVLDRVLALVTELRRLLSH